MPDVAKELTKQLCHDFITSRCARGENCPRLHPPEMGADQVNEADSRVPRPSREGGVACMRCMQRGYECDKSQRFPQPNDPCSECRWFGGPGCDCSLHVKSPNDVYWEMMMERAHSNKGYDLPAATSREKGRQKKTKEGKVVLPAEPMPDDEVRPDWQGVDRETLLQQRDGGLHPYVRAYPRRYLVPPAQTNQKKRKLAFEARGGKLGPQQKQNPSRAAPSEVRSGTSLDTPPVPPPPPTDFGRGQAKRVTYVRESWTYDYADGIPHQVETRREITTPSAEQAEARTSAAALQVAANPTGSSDAGIANPGGTGRDSGDQASPNGEEGEMPLDRTEESTVVQPSAHAFDTTGLDADDVDYDFGCYQPSP